MPATVVSFLAAVPLILPVVSPHTSPSYVPFGHHDPIAACSENFGLRAEDDRATRATPSSGPSGVSAGSANARASGVNWAGLGGDSARFLLIMHGFRWATEPGTRAGGVGLNGGYRAAIGNLHGWADGDPFYVNYIGHPMQGAVSANLFALNDRRFSRSEFGKNPEYWKGKLRAAAFAWAFSEQFEIGPLSEASIGHIQRDFPQQGFVDHVVTPSIGFAWIVGEDAVDRYVIRPLEDRTTNRWFRIALRTGLNPTRSFANLVDGRAPWDRRTRAGVLEYKPVPRTAYSRHDGGIPKGRNVKLAPFEFSVLSGYRQSGKRCLGGGAEGAYRLTSSLQLVLAVNGCKILDLGSTLSGDGLFYQMGPRWTPSPTGKWSPFAHFLVGGVKVAQEQFYPARKIAVDEENRALDPSLAYTLHDQYTAHNESSGMALSAGTGVDYRFNDALAIRVASVDYVYTAIAPINGTAFNNSFQFSTGMVLRIGSW